MHTMRAISKSDRITHLRCLASAIMLGAALFVAPASAQGDAPPPPPPGGGDLGGPKVPPGAKDGDENFGGEGRPGRRAGAPGAGMRNAMMSTRAWSMTWNEFKGTLSPEILGKAEQIQKEFDAKMQAWQKENGEKLRELAEQARGAAETGGRPDKETMEQMKQLNESRPKIEESHKQLFALLSPEQQESFKKKLAETEAKMKERAGKGGEGRPGGKGGKKPGGKPGDGGAGGDGNPPPPPPMDQ
jgi:Spy/CpxP family protein refolding chaperone